MSPRNEEQLKSLREDRKVQIMDAAIKVFANNGIKLTKISMIAKEAGVSHGLLYHYFQSKEEVLHKSLAWAMSGTDELFGQFEGLDLSPLEKIKRFTKLALMEGNSDTFRVIQHISRSEEVADETKKLVEEGGTIYIAKIYPLIVEGQNAGEIIEGDPQELLELFLTVLTGIMTDDLPWWNKNINHRVNLLLRMITTR